MITAIEVDPMLTEAWEYVHTWAEGTTSERVRRHSEEDGLMAVVGFLGIDNATRPDVCVGRISLLALGDNIEVELYDPRRILHGLVPHHPRGMPMQGVLSTRRGFEHETSLTHIGVNGELYRSGFTPQLVSPSPMDLFSKRAVLAYFETRLSGLIDTHQ